MSGRPHCIHCGSDVGVLPLHGDKGGPLMCFMCAGAWNAKHTKKRKAGRIVIKAIKAYEDAGGGVSDIDKLKLAAWGIGALGHDADTLGTDVGDITSELLDDVVKLTHPDRHPPEHKKLAQRVTQELLALKPFVFPAPKKEPTKVAPPADKREGRTLNDIKQELRKADRYPCIECVNEVPLYYCKECRPEWDKRQREERERESAKRREWRARRKARRALRQPSVVCPGCEKPFKPKRAGARHCSDTCRQRARRKRVTVKQIPTSGKPNNRDNSDAAVTDKERTRGGLLENRDAGAPRAIPPVDDLPPLQPFLNQLKAGGGGAA